MIWLAGVFLLCFTYFWHFEGDWNSHSRVDTLLALVNKGTFVIDDYAWNTGDTSTYHNRLYSNKAPGLTFLALPVMLAEKGTLVLLGHRHTIERMGLNAPADPPYRVTADYIYTMNLLSFITVTIPAVLLLLLFYWFLGYYSSSVPHRVVVTLLLGLGTIVFPYARVLFSHIPTAALLFTAFVLIYSVDRRDGRGWAPRHPDAAAGLAGFCLGAAVLFEYPAVLISAVLGVYALIALKPGQVVLLVAWAIPPMCALLGYNMLIYHSPLATGYSGGYGVAHVHLESQGIAGFTLPPKFKAMWGMTFSRYRGLFFTSPWLLAALPGYWLWWKRDRRACIVALGVVVVYFLALSCFWGWYAGDSIGPRYLMLLLPFLAVPLLFVLDALTMPLVETLIYLLGWVSVMAIWTETIGGTSGLYPGPIIHNPLFKFSAPALLHGDITPSMGSSLLTLLPPTPAVLALLPLPILLGLWSFAAYTWYRAPSRSARPEAPMLMSDSGKRAASR